MMEQNQEPQTGTHPIESETEHLEEERVETPSPVEQLHAEWVSLRERITQRRTKVLQFLEDLNREPAPEDAGDEDAMGEDSMELLQTTFEHAKQACDQSVTSDGLRTLKAVIRRAKALEQRCNEQYDASEKLKEGLRRKIGAAQRRRGELESEQKELNDSNFFTRIFSREKKRLLSEGIYETTREIIRLRSEWDHLIEKQIDGRDESRRAWNLAEVGRKTIIEKTRPWIADAIHAEFLNIQHDYEQFFQSVTHDPFLLREINEQYTKNVIVPELKETQTRMLPGYPAVPEQQIIELLRGLDPRPEANDQRQAQHRELQTVAPWSNVADCYRPLIDNQSEGTLVKCLQKMEKLDLDPLIKVAETRLGPYWDDELRKRGSDHLPPQPFTWRKHEWAHEQFDHLPFWDALRQAPSTRRIFGEPFEQVDRQYGNQLLEAELKNRRGNSVSELKYFPQPEVIRVLILMITTDRNYYENGVCGALLSHLRRPDWPSIREATLAQYPSLQDCLDKLESFEASEWANYPAIQSALRASAQPLSELTANNTTEARELRMLAFNAMSTVALLRSAERLGVIASDQAHSLSHSLELLEGSPKTGRNDFAFSVTPFGAFIRSNVLKLIEHARSDRLSTWQAPDDLPIIAARMILFLEEVQKGKDDPKRQRYLKDLCELKRENPLFKKSLTDANITILLQADMACPALQTHNVLRELFFHHFAGSPTVELFIELANLFPAPNFSSRWIDSILSRKMSLDRMRTILERMPDLPNLPIGSIALDQPDLFLNTDEGLDHLKHLIDHGLTTTPTAIDQHAGQRLLQTERDHPITGVRHNLCELERPRAMQFKSNDETLTISEQNWMPFFLTLIHEAGLGYDLPQTMMTQKIHELFKGKEAKEFCRDAMMKLWREYLAGDDPDRLPFSLQALANAVHIEGAGPMSQLEALLDDIYAYQTSLIRKGTTTRTRRAIFEGMAAMEDRFERERWSREDQANFHYLSSGLISASPSLFTDVLQLASQFTPSQLKRFADELYPLIRTKLAMIERPAPGGRWGEIEFPARALVGLRRDLRQLGQAVSDQEIGAFEETRGKLIESLKTTFREKFGIVKLPEDFSEDHSRSLTNISLYLANLNDRTPERETILGYYLALMLNGEWDRFRTGESVDPHEFLVPEKARVVAGMLEQRKTNDTLTPDRLWLTAEQLPAFHANLQQEIQHVALGEVETVDVKLSNVLANLESLSDLDLYPDPLDQTRMNLLLEFGNKPLGGVVAKMYQELAHPDRRIIFNEAELRIKQAVETAMTTHQLERTPATIKQVFQDGIRAFSAIVNILTFSEHIHAEEEIAKLRGLLTPDDATIAVFNRLGEEFHASSGAMALTQDLTYLDNLVVKRAKDLRPEEQSMLVAYIQRIRDQLSVCEAIFEQVRNKVGTLTSSSLRASNPLLDAKVAEIARLIKPDADQKSITTTLTTDLNRIIENIRECLSCKESGCNNDTNLTFGDSNKFFLTSSAEDQGQARGISDQILYLEPVTLEDRTTEMAFVFDRIYGSMTPSVVTNHLQVVLKRIRGLRKQFPETSISLLIPAGVFPNTDASPKALRTKLPTIQGFETEIQQGSFTVDIAPSAAGDHYLEFGSGTARSSGKRPVNGVIIRLKAAA